VGNLKGTTIFRGESNDERYPAFSLLSGTAGVLSVAFCVVVSNGGRERYTVGGVMKVRPRIALVVSALALFAACSSRQAATPAAPSSTPTPSSTPAATGSATIAGTVVGMSTLSGWSARGANMTVTVVGSASSAGVDGNGHFTLVNVPAGHADLHFMGNGADAHLMLDGIASNQTLTISVRVSGSAATIEDDHQGPSPGPNPEVQLEGLVTALGASSLTVSGRIVNVTAATVIVHGETTIPFSSIHVGDRVHVKGTPASATAPDGPVNATKIEVQNPAGKNPDDNDDDDDEKNEVELKGTIAPGSLGGSCATNSLTFKVGSTAVISNAATQFKDTPCAALAAGDPVEVKGTRQANATVLASRIEKKH
jgi:Domain of unknown function (DUF5666)